MKKLIYSAIIALAGMGSALAQEHGHEHGHEHEISGVEVRSASLTRNAGLMTVDFSVDISELELRSDRAVVFTPEIVNGEHSVSLSPIGLYGRTRWYRYVRSGAKPVGGADERVIKWSEVPSELVYNANVPYAEWMNGSELLLIREEYGCCRELADTEHAHLAGYEFIEPKEYIPANLYMRPAAETSKLRALSGSAFIDFVVNRTEINPTYRNNAVELRKITATIDSVRNDADVTVKAITIKGFASPEGSYANNARLAKGRTESLKGYVRNLYKFDDDFIAADYEPEDWGGLRRYVEGSGLEHRTEILSIIDDAALEPDARDQRIKSRYPSEYGFLLREVYPALRHSDYTIEYEIRQFSDVDEIRRIMSESPQKLSLNEFFVLAQSYEEGSAEFNEVFETAVRMYPNDAVANLNAAVSCMERGDLIMAERYLSKSGAGAEAEYGRGVLAIRQKDYESARAHLLRASELGLSVASSTLEDIKDMK